MELLDIEELEKMESYVKDILEDWEVNSNKDPRILERGLRDIHEYLTGLKNGLPKKETNIVSGLIKFLSFHFSYTIDYKNGSL